MQGYPLLSLAAIAVVVVASGMPHALLCTGDGDVRRFIFVGGWRFKFIRPASVLSLAMSLVPVADSSACTVCRTRPEDRAADG